MTARYVAILIRREIDRFAHNDLFAEELSAAFRARGWACKVIDYIAQPRETFAAIRDPDCGFIVTFNGFGTELQMATARPGQLEPVFDLLRKPVFDLMHDCPAHETMGHQVRAVSRSRNLLCTDHDYAAIAKDLGVQNVALAPTITFPASLTQAPKRDIDILIAVGLSPPAFSRDRLEMITTKGRLFRMVFDDVASRCSADWSANPIYELRNAFHDLGLQLNVRDADHRFLLTIILDFAKFERRRQILASLGDIPVTLISDRELPDLPKNVTTRPTRTAKELLNLMSRCKVVICPTTHTNGYHERPMFAFTAGAVVVSAPNGPLQSHFAHGDDILFCKKSISVRETVIEALKRPEIGERGNAKALSLFKPERLIDTILNGHLA